MTALFARTSWLRSGYDTEEVDEFFEHARISYESASLLPGDALTEVQTVVFDTVRRGYRIEEVDAALDRLEAALVAKAKDVTVARSGAAGWNQALAERAQTLYGRLTRPEGERFDTAAARKRGYDVHEVDALLDRLTAFFDQGVPITAQEVRQATFRSQGRRRGYDEKSVDAFLRRTVEVLLGAS